MRNRLLVLAAGTVLALAGCSAASRATPDSSASSDAPTSSTLAGPGPSRGAPDRHSPMAAVPERRSGPVPTLRPRSAPPASTPGPAGAGLPLSYATAGAGQVITVVAPSTGSTTGTLQAWQRGASGWQPVGGPVPAWLGSDGLTTQPSESISATPIGSFTLTNAFGYDANPGTSLPYVQTTPADWWISQPGPLYNTRQRCSGSCPFAQGDPNEHLYDERPYYAHAVVIDYNTANAPGGVRQGAGSAFFLHVAVGSPTAGCVAIPADQLVRIMQWLSPSQHPRILIGVGGAGG